MSVYKFDYGASEQVDAVYRVNGAWVAYPLTDV